MIRAHRLEKSYGRGDSRVVALGGVDLEVEAGEVIAIVGKSGSGKSTLVNLLGGLDRPDQGSLEVDGHDIAQLDRDGLARYRRQTVGLVFQSFNLVPTLDALSNVALPLVFEGVPKTERRKKARFLLDRVGLSQRADHLPSELSGGEQQRVALARAMVCDPRLLLADEPTGNLDSVTAEAVIELLLGSQEDGTARTLILVTHDDELAERASNRVVRLVDGRVAS
ncbi:MAG: ABC transporter ATP-binding protein [Planctomycetota bacterium]